MCSLYFSDVGHFSGQTWRPKHTKTLTTWKNLKPTIQKQEPYEPPIHDFTIERDGEDFTEAFLMEDKLIVVISYNLDNADIEGFAEIKKATDAALQKGYKVIGLSASSTAETEQMAKNQKLNFDFYFCDMTTLKTIVRSNPGLLELHEGTILQKLHWNDIEDLKLN